MTGFLSLLTGTGNNLENSINYLLDCQRGCVDPQGIFGLSKRAFGPGLIARVPFFQVGQDFGERDLLAGRDQLFVPALVFPVTGELANEYETRNYIVVPLVQELYDNTQNQGYPMPMPLMEDAPLPVDLGDPTGGPAGDNPEVMEEPTPDPAVNPEPLPMN